MNELYLGVARENITPRIGGQLYGYRTNIFSDSVLDDLTVTAFYFKQGSIEALMISATVCLIQTEMVGRILKEIENKYGIPKHHCMISATHTHSGPNTVGTYGWGDIDLEYCENIFIPQILAAVKRAMSCVCPVKVGIATGKSYAGVNRREVNLDNRAFLGQNEWGIFDPRMTVISFQNDEKKIVANMIHYGMHGTAAGGCCGITRDWSGVMTDALEKNSGGITAFFNGAEGDVGPRLMNGLTWGKDGARDVYEIGHIAAHDAVAIFKEIHSFENVMLNAFCGAVKIPLEKRESYTTALDKYELYKDKTVNLGGHLKKHFEDVIASYNSGCEDASYSEFVQVLISIGGVTFVSFPYELFSEISLRINKASDVPYVLSLSNTNGSEGYFVTQDQICRGGYEVSMFLCGHLQAYCQNADEHIIKQTLKNINEM